MGSKSHHVIQNTSTHLESRTHDKGTNIHLMFSNKLPFLGSESRTHDEGTNIHLMFSNKLPFLGSAAQLEALPRQKGPHHLPAHNEELINLRSMRASPLPSHLESLHHLHLVTVGGAAAAQNFTTSSCRLIL